MRNKLVMLLVWTALGGVLLTGRAARAGSAPSSVAFRLMQPRSATTWPDETPALQAVAGLPRLWAQPTLVQNNSWVG
jgi:hypothetical protein